MRILAAASLIAVLIVPSHPLAYAQRSQFSPTSYIYSVQFGNTGPVNETMSAPRGIAFDSSNDAYVVNSNSAAIQKFDLTGNYVGQWGSIGYLPGQLGIPWGLAIDHHGHVYVADSLGPLGGSNSIDEYDLAGNFLGVRNPDPLNGSYGSITVDSYDNLYVLDSSMLTSRITKYDPTGNILLQWNSHLSGNGVFAFLTGIAVDDNSNVYISDSTHYQVQKYDSNGTYLSSWGSVGNGNGQFNIEGGPGSIAIDSRGDILVVDPGNFRVEAFDPTGAYLTQWGANGSGNGQFQSPWGLAIDNSGRVVVTDTAQNRAEVFLPLSPQSFLPFVPKS